MLTDSRAARPCSARVQRGCLANEVDYRDYNQAGNIRVLMCQSRCERRCSARAGFSASYLSCMDCDRMNRGRIYSKMCNLSAGGHFNHTVMILQKVDPNASAGSSLLDEMC